MADGAFATAKLISAGAKTTTGAADGADNVRFRVRKVVLFFPGLNC
jgi:hypothetical protein